MDQRPPSSAATRPDSRHQQRPGTASVRRPKTAGRNSERPPSSVGRQPTVASSTQPPTIPHRPQSRIGLTSDMMAPTVMAQTEYVANGPVPSSRALSRRGLQSAAGGGRPGTVMASRAGHAALPMGIVPAAIGAEQRPVTQQGIRGARQSSAMGRRVQSRMGTAMGGGRQVADKTYFVGLLNNQLNALETEIESLGEELEKAERGRENLLAYEQRAEEQAQELKQLQGELADYNMIIDRQNTNSSLRSLGTEVAAAGAVNRELGGEVEELFRERRVREETVQELEQRIARVRTENATKMGEMERELKDEFQRVSAEAEALAAELARKQAELDQMAKSKEEMDLALANSPLRQQAMVLEEQLQELREKRAAIVAELNSEQTPEAQREHFMQRIQRDNEEIVHMQTQLHEMGERMAQAQEELQEFQNEFELLAGDKSEKFRELKQRETQMDAFLDGFETAKMQREQHIGALSAQIVRQLQLISVNCRHTELAAATNISGLDESVLALGSGVGASAPELQDLHVRLQDELITLGQSEALLQTEISSMRVKQSEIETAMRQMSDVEAVRVEMSAKGRELHGKRAELEEQLARAEAENGTLRAQMAEEERRLGTNAQLAKLRELKSKVDSLEAERGAADEKLRALMAEYDYESAKQRAMELRAQYNELLVNAAAGSRTKSAH